MQSRPAILIVLAVAIATLYAVFFLDWRQPKKIRVSWHLVPAGTLGHRKIPTVQFFLVDLPTKISSVKVVPAADAAAKSPHVLWELTSKHDVPVTGFMYGFPIRGMTPVPPGSRAEPLQPGGQYVLIVASGKHREGQTVFQAPQ